MIKKLENKFLSLSFNTEQGRVVSILNKVSGDEYIKQNNTSEMFELTCMNLKNERICLYPENVNSVEITANGEEQLLRAEYYIKDEFIVWIEIRLRNESSTLKWNIEIFNNSDKYEITEVLYPRIRGIYLGSTWKDNVIILPHHAGEKTVNPIEEYKKPEFKEMFRAEVKNDGNINYRELNYCGLASMTWMYYYNKNNGFYISSYDDNFPVTGLRFETSADLTPWVGFAIRKYLVIKSKEKWISKPYATSINCEDWHWGAKTYRKWIDRYIRMPENPEYLKEQYALMNMYEFKREGKVHYKFNDIPYIFDYAKSYGINHLFMAGWNRFGFDQNYPEYYPDLELGTSMDLYSGCDYINRHKGIATFYINARIFDIHSDYFNSLGKAIAIKNSEGNMIHEKYGEYEFTVSCPSHKVWQKYVIDTAIWMAKAYNAKGIYLDQLGSAEPYPCYDKEHSHKDTGEFANGYLEILKKVKSEINKINPESFIMIENCGDIYGSYTWGNLTWNDDVQDEFFNLFKYTFPEYVQVNMINPKGINNAQRRAEKFYADIERALILGSILWINPLTKFDHEDENDIKLLKYLKKAIDFRKKINLYIMDSKFVDTDGIYYMSDDLKVTHWLGIDKEICIIGNTGLKGGVFEVGNKYKSVITYTIDGDSITNNYVYVQDKIKITVPNSRVSFVIFEK